MSNNTTNTTNANPTTAISNVVLQTINAEMEILKRLKRDKAVVLLKLLEECKSYGLLSEPDIKVDIYKMLEIPLENKEAIVFQKCPCCDYESTEGTKPAAPDMEVLNVPEKADIERTKIIPYSMYVNYATSLAMNLHPDNDVNVKVNETLEDLKKRIKDETGYSVKMTHLKAGNIVFVDKDVKIQEDKVLFSEAKKVQNANSEIQQPKLAAYHRVMICSYLPSIITYVLKLSTAEVIVLRQIFNFASGVETQAYTSFRKYLKQASTGYAEVHKLGFIRNIQMTHLEFEYYNTYKLYNAYKTTNFNDQDDDQDMYIHTRFAKSENPIKRIPPQ